MRIKVWVLAVVLLLFAAGEVRSDPRQAPQPWVSLDFTYQVESVPGKWKKTRKKATDTLDELGLAISTNENPIEGEYVLRVSIYAEAQGEEGKQGVAEVVWSIEWRLDRGTYLRGILREVESGYIPIPTSDVRLTYQAVAREVDKVAHGAAGIILRHTQELYDRETQNWIDWGNSIPPEERSEI